MISVHEMQRVRVEVLDDNESITLRVSTTVGMSGIAGVDTAGDADAAEPIRLECTVSRTHDGHSRVRYGALVLGQSLLDALADRPAEWTRCEDLTSQVEGAIDRLVPGWRNGLYEAEVQVEAEAETTDDDLWSAELSERPASVSWWRIADAVQS
jgi:hypothetical protein